jgi:hypothetical protein
MDAASQEARSEAERRRWFAAASAAVERRQASALRSARSRIRLMRNGRIRVCRRFAFLIFIVESIWCRKRVEKKSKGAEEIDRTARFGLLGRLASQS